MYLEPTFFNKFLCHLEGNVALTAFLCKVFTVYLPR